jgi:hypothetical protein
MREFRLTIEYRPKPGAIVSDGGILIGIVVYAESLSAAIASETTRFSILGYDVIAVFGYEPGYGINATAWAEVIG